MRSVELLSLPACPRPAGSWKGVRGAKPARRGGICLLTPEVLLTPVHYRRRGTRPMTTVCLENTPSMLPPGPFAPTSPMQPDDMRLRLEPPHGSPCFPTTLDTPSASRYTDFCTATRATEVGAAITSCHEEALNDWARALVLHQALSGRYAIPDRLSRLPKALSNLTNKTRPLRCSLIPPTLWRDSADSRKSPSAPGPIHRGRHEPATGLSSAYLHRPPRLATRKLGSSDATTIRANNVEITASNSF